MGRFRYSIAGLLGVVLCLAFALAALREASDLWDSLVFSLTLGLLAVSVLLAVYRNRPFWVGFAVFGWGYLAASLIPTVEHRLLTTKALAYVDSKVPGRGTPLLIRFTTTNGGPARSVAFSQSGQMLATSTNGTVRVWNAVTGRLLSGPGGTSESFVRIGHSLAAVFAAFAGGCLSRRLWRQGRIGGGD